MAVESVAYIYYDVLDKAFERAARWHSKNLSSTSLVEFASVVTKQDFLNAWNGIRQQAITNNTNIASIHLFTHASKQDNLQDGLEFASSLDESNTSTLTRNEILNLAKMPWSTLAYMHLYGCNTGLVETRGWCPAATFSIAQGVKAIGQTGWAYFSTNKSDYSEASPSDNKLYLYAYNRGRNNILGDGNLMEEAVFNP